MVKKNEIRDVIVRLFLEIFAEQGEKIAAPTLEDETILLDTGMDSLGFAILVARLEEELGYDPFTLSKDPFYPKNFQEFVVFYEDYHGIS